MLELHGILFGWSDIKQSDLPRLKHDSPYFSILSLMGEGFDP
jgi:hypothetical protein